MEFHDDIFPDTPSDVPGLSSSEWFSGSNGQVKKILMGIGGGLKRCWTLTVK
jgi:hypothetical protein